jgi:hypothetical protein
MQHRQGLETMNETIRTDHSEQHEQVSQNTSLRGGMMQTSRQLSRVHRTFQRKAKAVATRRMNEDKPAVERVPATVG